jgi:hypothetical protein
MLEKFTCFTTPTLPHLIALLCHPSPSFPPNNTALIIVDSFSTLITNTYPRTLDLPAATGKAQAGSKQDLQQRAAARKWSVYQFIVSSLQKLATLHNIAIVLLNQTATKMTPGSKARLVPAVSSTAWDAGIGSRVLLFRDWGWDGKQVRLARVLKADGVVATTSGASNVVAFTIEESGLHSLPFPSTHTPGMFPHILTPVAPALSTSSVPQKRKAVDERVDSADEDEGDDEDYGWAAVDEEELPPPPPQGQGSEDVLVPVVELEKEVEEEREKGWVGMGVDDGEEEEDEEGQVVREHVSDRWRRRSSV